MSKESRYDDEKAFLRAVGLPIPIEKPKVLHLILSNKWFSEIDSGRKTVEYRDNTPYWAKRILHKPRPILVVFHKGYSKQIIVFAISSIKIIGMSSPNQEIEIHLGERLRKIGEGVAEKKCQ